jgi:hypothetical protein
MERISISSLVLLAVTYFSGLASGFAQGSPDIVWEVPTPSGLANSIVGAGWAPGSSGQVAVGSTDRWLRTRQSANGSLIYSILGPQHSRGGDQTIYSTDGMFLAVHNRNRGPNYRVYRASDGLFLGTIVVTIDSRGIVQFAPDAQLLNSVPGGTMGLWLLEKFTVVTATGSGYDIITTTINISPKGLYQSTATTGTIKIFLAQRWLADLHFFWRCCPRLYPRRLYPRQNRVRGMGWRLKSDNIVASRRRNRPETIPGCCS